MAGATTDLIPDPRLPDRGGRPLTVGDLIRVLQDFPPDLRVYECDQNRDEYAQLHWALLITDRHGQPEGVVLTCVDFSPEELLP